MSLLGDLQDAYETAELDLDAAIEVHEADSLDMAMIEQRIAQALNRLDCFAAQEEALASRVPFAETVGLRHITIDRRAFA